MVSHVYLPHGHCQIWFTVDRESEQAALPAIAGSVTPVEAQRHPAATEL